MKSGEQQRAITQHNSKLNSSKDSKPEQGQRYDESVARSFTAAAAAITVSTLTQRMANIQLFLQAAIIKNMDVQQQAIGQGKRKRFRKPGILSC